MGRSDARPRVEPRQSGLVTTQERGDLRRFHVIFGMPHPGEPDFFRAQIAVWVPCRPLGLETFPADNSGHDNKKETRGSTKKNNQVPQIEPTLR